MQRLATTAQAARPEAPIRTLRVLLIGEHELTRDAVAGLIGARAGMEVVAAVRTGQDAVRANGSMPIDVAVLQVLDPAGHDGLATLKSGARALRCVVLTSELRPGVVRGLLRAGADGIVSTSVSTATLADAIRSVAGGHSYVDPCAAGLALAVAECPLRERECEVLRHVDGVTLALDIGRRLGLSAGTVRNYLSSAIRKLGARNRFDAARIATENGWI